MRIAVGRFICEFSRDHRGQVRAEWWLRASPMYLGKDERRTYQAARREFVESTRGGVTSNAADRPAAPTGKSLSR